jgi:Flp pilus assembly protein protease CpaA
VFKGIASWMYSYKSVMHSCKRFPWQLTLSLFTDIESRIVLNHLVIAEVLTAQLIELKTSNTIFAL